MRQSETMAQLAFSLLLVFFISNVFGDEPHCSKYDFEEKVLEKLVRMEFKMERQKSELTEALQSIVDSKSAVDSMRKDFEKLKETMETELGSKSTELEQQTKNVLDRKIEEIDLLNDTFSAPKLQFRAVLRRNTEISKGDIVVFPEVLYNEGGYDRSTGIFTATVNGTHIFAVRLCPYSNRYIRLSFQVDDTEQDAFSLFVKEGNTCYSAETSVVLMGGQKVHLRAKNTGLFAGVYGNEYNWNTFTGVSF